MTLTLHTLVHVPVVIQELTVAMEELPREAAALLRATMVADVS